MPAPTVTSSDGVSTSSPVNVAVSGVSASDFLVLVISKANTGTLSAPSGFGAGSWSAFRNWQVESGATRLYVYTLTGVSGAGNVTITTGGAAGGFHYTLYIIKNLNTATIAAYTESTWYAINGTVQTTPAEANTPINTDEGPASIGCNIDQVALFLVVSNAPAQAHVFPSNPTPASGWTSIDRINTGAGNPHACAYLISGSVQSVQANYRDTVGNTKMGTVMLVTGTATPPPSGFEGWGMAI